MSKTIFLPFFDKFFFVTPLCSVLQKEICQNGKKMVFDIFKVILDFNDLCPFLIFKLIIFKNFELWQIWKYAQTLVIYSIQKYGL